MKNDKIKWQDVIALDEGIDDATKARYEGYLERMQETEQGQKDLKQIQKNTRFLSRKGFENPTEKLLITVCTESYNGRDETATIYDYDGSYVGKANTVQISPDEIRKLAYYDAASNSYKPATEEEALRHELVHAAMPAFRLYIRLTQDSEKHLKLKKFLRKEETRAIEEVNEDVRFNYGERNVAGRGMTYILEEYAPKNPVKLNDEGRYVDVVTGEKIIITPDEVLDRGDYDRANAFGTDKRGHGEPLPKSKKEDQVPPKGKVDSERNDGLGALIGNGFDGINYAPENTNSAEIGTFPPANTNQTDPRTNTNLLC